MHTLVHLPRGAVHLHTPRRRAHNGAERGGDTDKTLTNNLVHIVVSLELSVLSRERARCAGSTNGRLKRQQRRCAAAQRLLRARARCSGENMVGNVGIDR